MRWLAILLLLINSSVYAAIDHISVNRLEYGRGQMAYLYMNVVGDQRSRQQLQFYLQQGPKKQSLRHLPVSQFQLVVELDRTAVSDGAVLVSTLLHVSDDALGSFELAAAPVEETIRPMPTKPATRAAAKRSAKPSAKPSTTLPAKQDIEQVMAPAQVAATVPEQVAATKQPARSAGVDCALQQGETLWRGGKRLASGFNLGRYGMMLALFDANPSRFNGNPQRMRSGKLQCPSEAVVARWGDEVNAKKQFGLMIQQ